MPHFAIYNDYKTIQGLFSMFAQKQANSIRNHIDRLSSQYIGKPYISNPLNDSDRRIRYDGFDCLTYVETIIAFSRKASEKNILGVMDQIRYKDGGVGFVRRHHIVEQSWIPENIKKGLVKDVTERYAQQMQIQLHHAESFADPKGFYEKLHFDELQKEYKVETREEWDALVQKMKETNEIPDCLKGVNVSCPYLSIQDLLQNSERLKHLETGTILWIVRPNWGMKESTGTDLVISHLGFTIRGFDGSILFRHATSNDPKQVVDVLLEDYLAQYKDPTQTTVRGIRLLDVCPDLEPIDSPPLKRKK